MRSPPISAARAAGSMRVDVRLEDADTLGLERRERTAIRLRAARDRSTAEVLRKPIAKCVRRSARTISSDGSISSRKPDGRSDAAEAAAEDQDPVHRTSPVFVEPGAATLSHTERDAGRPVGAARSSERAQRCARSTKFSVLLFPAVTVTLEVLLA